MKILVADQYNKLLQHLFADIAAFNYKWPDKRAFFIVPETLKADIERQFLSFGESNLLMTEIVSFRRFYERLADEAGKNDRRYMTRVGKALLVQRLLSSHRDEMQILQKIAGKPYYAEELAKVLGDFSRYEVDTAKILQLLGEALAAKAILGKNKTTAVAAGATSPNTSPQAPELADTIDSSQAPKQADSHASPQAPERADSTASPQAPERADTTASPQAPERADTTASPQAPERADTTASPQAQKLYDLCRLKEILQAEITTKKIIDRDYVLNELIALISSSTDVPRLHFLRDASIFIYGFGSDRLFTAQEKKVIDALCLVTEDICIALKCETSTLKDAGSGRQISDTTLAKTDVPKRADYYFGNLTLQYLQQKYHAAVQVLPSKIPAEENFANADLEIVLGASKAKSTQYEYVAGYIRTLLKQKACSRHDIAIAMAGGKEESAAMAAVLHRYGIDAYSDNGKTLSASSVARVVRAILAISLHHYELETFMQYFASGLCESRQYQVDDFENFCLRYGLQKLRHSDVRALRGKSVPDIEAYLCDRLHFEKEENEKTPISANVLKVFAELSALLNLAAKLSKVSNYKAKINLLQDFLFAEDAANVDKIRSSAGADVSTVPEIPEGFYTRVQKKVRFLAHTLETAQAQDNDFTTFYAALHEFIASFNAISDLLSEASDILGDSECDNEEFVNTVIAGIDSLTLSTIPPGYDRVGISDLKTASRRFSQYLFIVAATTENFPPPKESEGFLSDSERRNIAQTTGKDFPDRTSLYYYRSAELLHSLRNTAKQKIIITTGVEDKENLPAAVKSWVEIKGQLAAENASTDDTLANVSPEEAVSGKENLEVQGCHFVYLRDNALDVRWSNMFYVKRHLARQLKLAEKRQYTEQISLTLSLPSWQQKFKSIIDDAEALIVHNALAAQRRGIDRGQMAKFMTMLPSYKIDRPILLPEEVSVSLLQQYARCPFQYFADRVLQLKERKVAQLTFNDTGTLYHAMLENFTRKLLAAKNFDLFERQCGAFNKKSYNDKIYVDLLQQAFGAAENYIFYDPYAMAKIAGSILHSVHVTIEEALKAYDVSQQFKRLPVAAEFNFPHDLYKYAEQKSGLVEALEKADMLRQFQYHFTKDHTLQGRIDRMDVNLAGAKLFSQKDILQVPAFYAVLDQHFDPDTGLGIAADNQKGAMFSQEQAAQSVLSEEAAKEARIFLTDYKSTKKLTNVSNNNLYHGMDLQLPLYRDYCAKIFDVSKVAGSITQFGGHKKSSSTLYDYNATLDALKLENAQNSKVLAEKFPKTKEQLKPQEYIYEAAPAYAHHKAVEIISRIEGMDFTARATRLKGGQNKIDACKYCKFQTYCGFDETTREGEFTNFVNADEICKKMQEVLD